MRSARRSSIIPDRLLLSSRQLGRRTPLTRIGIVRSQKNCASAQPLCLLVLGFLRKDRRRRERFFKSSYALRHQRGISSFATRKTGLSLIAFNVGFSDQAHLTREFQRHAGVSPGAFKQAWRGRNARAAEDRRARQCLQPSDSENRKAAPRPFSSPSNGYHGRYYDGFLVNLYLAKGLILLVGAPGLEPGTR